MLILDEGIVTDGHDLAQIDDLQGITACEGVLGDLRDIVIEDNFLHIPAVSKGVFADGLRAGQIHTLKGRCVVGINVLAFRADCGISHGIIDADIVNIAGEGVIADGGNLAQVNFLQACVVVEGHVADLGIFAQGHGLQTCCIGEGIVTDHRIVANGQGLQRSGEGVVEILLFHGLTAGSVIKDVGKGFFRRLGLLVLPLLSDGLGLQLGIGFHGDFILTFHGVVHCHRTCNRNFLGVAFHSEAVIGADMEGILAQGDIIANDHALQLQALT